MLDLSSSKDSLIKEYDEYVEGENIFDLSKSMIYNEISIKQEERAQDTSLIYSTNKSKNLCSDYMNTSPMIKPLD